MLKTKLMGWRASFILSFTLLSCSVSLVACSHDNVDPAQIQSANSDRVEMDSIQLKLRWRGIDLNAPHASKLNLNQLGASDLEANRRQLQRFLALGANVLAVTSQKGVVYEGRGRLQVLMVSAATLLKDVETQLAELGTPAAVPSVDDGGLKAAEEKLDANFSFAGIDTTRYERKKYAERLRKLAKPQRQRLLNVARENENLLTFLIDAREALGDMAAVRDLENQREHVKALARDLQVKKR